MHIAMIGQKGIPAKYGGVERHVHDLSASLAKAGHTVTVYSRAWYSGNTSQNIHSRVSSKLVPSLETKHLDTITHVLLSSIHALFGHYDVIHYHGVGPSLLSWIPRLFAPKTKVITTFHSIDRYDHKWGGFARVVLSLAERTATTFAHTTITVSQSLQQYCLKEYRKETMYIPNAVAPFDHNVSSLPLQRFGLTEKNYIAMVARLIPLKGAHLLIDAFVKLKEQHANDSTVKNLKLAIIGGSAKTDSYVKSLHLQANTINTIVFTGFQSDETLHALVKNAIAIVHPSLTEGLPITVLEAMNTSTPVLVSNIPEHLELIQDPRIIFSQNNVDAIERALWQFLSLPQEERDAIVAVNKQMITDHYTWEIILPKIIEIYIDKTKKTKKHQIENDPLFAS